MAAIGISVLFVGVITFSLFWLYRYLKMRKVLDKLQGPRAYFLIGNVHQFKRDPDDWFEQAAGVTVMYQKPRMLRAWVGPAPYLIMYGAEEIETVLSSNKHINKGREYQLLHPWLGLGLLTSYAEKWRPRRKLLTPTFHYDILKDFVEVFNHQSRIMVKKLEPFAGKGSLDVYRYITLCALDIICESAMGRFIHAQNTKDSKYVAAIYKINDIIHERQKKPWLWIGPIFNWFGRGREHEDALKTIHGFTEKVIQERKDELDKAGGVQNLINNNNGGGGKRRLAFLDLLLDMVEQGKLPANEVRMEVDTFMFEGHDTTSAGMCWTLHLLGTNPDCQNKVLEEIDQVFGDDDREITFEDMKHLVYLERCIKEALRLFPSVPMYTRHIQEEMQVCGYTIPAGTQILINPYAVHRDPKHWPDPEIFDPDRFLPDNCAGRHPYAYVPFSAGNRNCIGQRFALMEEKTVLAQVFRYFKVRSIHRRDQVRPTAELILRPSKGVHLELTLRRKPGFELRPEDYETLET